MSDKRTQNKAKKILQGILIILIFLLVTYIVLVFVGNKNKEDLIGKISTFFQVFTVGVDTKISEVDNTILDQTKKVEIEESVGKVDVSTGVKQPLFIEDKKDAEVYAAPTANAANGTYYNQLDQYGKIIYTKLKNESAYFLEGQHTFDFGYGFNDLLNTPDGDTVLKKAFQYSINSLIFDYPELFFVDIEQMSLAIEKTEYNNKKAIHKVTIVNVEGEKFYIKGLNTKEEVNNRRKAMFDEKDRVLAATQSMNTYEKIQYIHNYIVDRTEYDKTLKKDNIYNASGPLLERYAVCEGYAKAFKFLMDGAKIPTIIVAGKAYDDYGKVERHAWNYVNLNNNWYLVDTTWDDPIIIGASGLTNEYRYKYFLVGRSTTRKSHVEDGNIVNDAHFKYPVLSEHAFGD